MAQPRLMGARPDGQERTAAPVRRDRDPLVAHRGRLGPLSQPGEEKRPRGSAGPLQAKSSGEYRARLGAQVLIKQRSHEQLVADFGRWAIQRGYTASTDVHP